MEIFILILLIITLAIRVLIGVRLFSSAKENNLPNLRWLAWYFCANAFIVFFSPHPYNPLGNLSFSLALFVLPLLLTQIALVLFNQDTFYKDKPSPARWFWAAFALTSLGTIYGVVVSPSNSEQSPWVATYLISQFLIWSWHAQVAYQAWSNLAGEHSVEDWIKTRYLLIPAYSIAFLIGAVGTAVRIIFTGGAGNNPVGITSAAVTLIAQFISVVLQYLVWVMPVPFRAWLNRNYQTHLNEYSEHQSKAILQMIGASISRDANVNQFIALHTIRQAIGKKISSDNSEAIEKHISGMGYKEWVDLLHSYELTKQISLVNTGSGIDRIIENANKTLIEKQSLFTIESK
jgi:hypothetical protein